MAAIVHAKFPGDGKRQPGLSAKGGAGDYGMRVTYASIYRRLPTKREIRARLEAIGIGYARSKDPDGQVGRIVRKRRFGGASGIILQKYLRPAKPVNISFCGKRVCR